MFSSGMIFIPGFMKIRLFFQRLLEEHDLRVIIPTPLIPCNIKEYTSKLKQEVLGRPNRLRSFDIVPGWRYLLGITDSAT
jgi:hypothetical protein